MLIISPGITSVDWDAAGITLDLVPLLEDVDQQFIKETTRYVYDKKGRLQSVEKDTPAYAQMVGNYCIKGWRGMPDEKGKETKGVCDKDGNKAPCDEVHINQFMLIDVAQNFVFSQVKGLALHLRQEEKKAKKD